LPSLFHGAGQCHKHTKTESQTDAADTGTQIHNDSGAYGCSRGINHGASKVRKVRVYIEKTNISEQQADEKESTHV